jgi:hypothetical protein
MINRLSDNNIAILVIFFNRPQVFLQQLRSLKKIKPKLLYFAADGQRSSNLQDLSNLDECKLLISSEIDWECNVHFFFSQINHGCDIFVPMSIDWFFDHVDFGIILEDDCIISNDFYRFCAHLLVKYADNSRIMNISSANFQNQKWGTGDYYFSRYPANWAWGTWRRAWKYFDIDMASLDLFLGPSGEFNKINLSEQERRFWRRFFLGLKSGRYSFWDAKWVYAIWRIDGVSITPNLNLSTNIGYGTTATHTKDLLKIHALPIQHLEKVIVEPQSLDIEVEADYFLFKKYYKPNLSSYLRAAIDRFKSFF